MIRIFLGMKAQYIKTEMEYAANFWMMILSGVLSRVVSMAAPFVIYSNIPDIAGWKKDEIYLILSFLFIAEGLCSVLFEGIWQMPGMVFAGEFDCILSRPVSPLFQVLSYGMGLHQCVSGGRGQYAGLSAEAGAAASVGRGHEPVFNPVRNGIVHVDLPAWQQRGVLV